MAGSLEIRLFNLIRELHQEIVDMKPEGGFSNPKDLELMMELIKKSAVLETLEKAMRIYNPYFKDELKQESKKDFSKNPRFDPYWMLKKIDRDNSFEQDYINIWSKVENAHCLEELMVNQEFSFNSNTDIKSMEINNFIIINNFQDLLNEYRYIHNENNDYNKLIPTIHEEIRKVLLRSRNIKSFTLSEYVDKNAIEINISEVKDLFLYYGEAPFKIDLGFDDLVGKGLVIIFNNNTQIRFRLSDVILKADNENT